MLAELYQITSILSNVCVILIITWLVIKYFQFKKYISYYIKMTQPVDQIDQLLLDAVVASDSATSFQQVQTADNKMKEKIIQVVASGKSKRYLGKVMTTKEIEQLNDEGIQKLYARYKAVLGGLITNKLKPHMCYAYSRAVSFICPTLNFKVEDIAKLTTSLSEGPFIDLALCSLTLSYIMNMVIF